ncbi:ABC transporter permease [Candidatus Bathyarchaeota archaeon]|nr:ABC transporter permease [Candidatus Bathyarchaeota archaeon]MBT4320216.1 ABC transporter permease [Candidatus Bathyarchaeota archaeon]MBT4423385.1 ABC transporter permease [Candidatus Bathyarchaeota archaeon]MBT6603961.1 ABC transporter permease [Candidatus Bathyarchaeota archaeon]MBT7186284.1 ABC transporter permease [Candidatus Bathyarchaeota archaeon]
MLNKLWSLVVKEVKELIRDPKILIGVILMPIIIFPIMGSAIQVSQESVQRAVRGASFAIWTDDDGSVTDALMTYLYNDNLVVPIEATNLEDALSQFTETDSSSLIYIPNGYNENVTLGQQGRLKIYANLRKLNMAETQSTDIVTSLINVYNYYFSIQKIENLIESADAAGTPLGYRNPITIDYASILKGNVLEIPPMAIFSLVMSQSIMLPIMVMMMVMFAIQMAATSIALEKEQKTLEILMTLPVSRMTILGGKLSGSIVIALAGSVSYLIGFGSYMNSAFSFVPDAQSMSLTDVNMGMTPFGFLLIGIVIFVTLIAALAMALSVAVFADNVRSAQSFTSVLITPIMVPALVLMFSDIEMLPLSFQYILLAIPYTHTMIAAKAAFLGEYFVVMRSILFISIWTVALLYIAARIFSTERIITARFTFGDIGMIFKRKK